MKICAPSTQHIDEICGADTSLLGSLGEIPHKEITRMQHCTVWQPFLEPTIHVIEPVGSTGDDELALNVDTERVLRGQVYSDCGTR